MFNDIISYIKSLYPHQQHIPLHAPVFTGNDKKYVTDAIDSTFVSSVGKYVDRFEEMIRDYTGSRYAIATVNGTAALHMSLILAGVKANDLVITQPLSFIATCNGISYLNAQPVFVDIDSKTLGLSAEALDCFLKEKCFIKDSCCFHTISGKRIGACVPMHTFGHPSEIDKIMELCNRYFIPVVEDAAESIGSTYKGKQTGTFGLLGAYSFNGNKIITCGGGGVIVTNNDELGKLAKHLTTQAKVPHRWEFKHDHIGYNYRMPNLNAALACAQLEQLDTFISNKRELAESYKLFFEKSHVRFFREPANAKSNYWLNAILLSSLEERNDFLTASNDNGVMTRPAWTLMNKLYMFKDCVCEDIGNAEYIEDRLVNIPSSVRLFDSGKV